MVMGILHYFVIKMADNGVDGEASVESEKENDKKG